MVPLSPLYGPQYVSRTALLATVTHPQTMDEADIVTSPSRGYIAPLPPRLPLAPPPPPPLSSHQHAQFANAPQEDADALTHLC
jgi:hypothetical protein